EGIRPVPGLGRSDRGLVHRAPDGIRCGELRRMRRTAGGGGPQTVRRQPGALGNGARIRLPGRRRQYPPAPRRRGPGRDGADTAGGLVVITYLIERPPFTSTGCPGAPSSTPQYRSSNKVFAGRLIRPAMPLAKQRATDVGAPP